MRKYVQGDRKKYFNAVTLILLLIGFSHFMEQYTIIPLEEIFSQLQGENLNAKVQKEVDKLNTNMFNVMRNYPKTTILSFIPFYALLSLWIFRKAKQNYAEHLVLVTYKMAMIVFIGYVVVIARIYSENTQLLSTLYGIAMLVGMVYTVIYMTRYFIPFYDKKRSAIQRSIAYTLTESIFQIVVGMLIAVVYFAIMFYQKGEIAL